MFRRMLRLDLTGWVCGLFLPELKQLPSRDKRREVIVGWWRSVPIELRVLSVVVAGCVFFWGCWSVHEWALGWLIDEEVGWLVRVSRCGLFVTGTVVLTIGSFFLSWLVLMCAFRSRGRRLLCVELNQMGQCRCLACGADVRDMVDHECPENSEKELSWFSGLIMPELKLLPTAGQREEAAKLWRAEVTKHWSFRICWALVCLCGIGVFIMMQPIVRFLWGIAGGSDGSLFAKIILVGLFGNVVMTVIVATQGLIIFSVYFRLCRERGRGVVRRALNQAGHSLCEVCGYDLRSLEGHRCPECGAYEIEEVLRTVEGGWDEDD